MQSDEYYTTLPKGSTVLSQDIEDLKGVYYRPRTKESRGTYELLLSFIQHCIGDQVMDEQGIDKDPVFKGHFAPSPYLDTCILYLSFS